jgi:alpha-glucosidase
MKKLASYYGKQDEMNLIINLAFLDSALEAPSLRTVVENIETALTYDNWPLWTASNHDKPRFPSRWAAGSEPKIRCAMLLMLALRGTPVLYYGDELGMEDVFVAPWRIKDPRGRKYWPIYSGRDRSRTPMPWQNQRGAGFTGTEVRPWLPYGDNRFRNVAYEQEHADSTLRFTKDLIALRRAEPDLHAGAYQTLPGTEQVWLWQRGSTLVGAINFSPYHQEVRHEGGEIVLGTVRQREGEIVSNLLHLDPWEGVIMRRAKP